MKEIGDFLYGMRIVKTYHGQIFEENPIFNGFEGIVVWNTWDTSEWQVLQTWIEGNEYMSREIGIIKDEEIQSNWNGEQVADFIKKEVLNMLKKEEKTYKVTAKQVREELLNSNIVAPRNVPALQHITRKSFNALTDKMTEYINHQIQIALQSLRQHQLPMAIDEVIASIIQVHDERRGKSTY